MFEEIVYISVFTIYPNGVIEVRTTTDVYKDGVPVASSFVIDQLQPNDPNADAVLGVGTYWRGVAQYAWDNLPAN